MSRWHLLDALGVEIEYMIVDQRTLNVRAVADALIHSAGTGRKNDVSRGAFKWSNELVAHVVEIKTNGPVPTLDGVAAGFQQQVDAINSSLLQQGCCLLPAGMHPWMNPLTETVLWPHDDREIYEAFDSVFGCKGHGWSNLQSAHLNLSFSGDEEFRRLHSAIRLVLPLIPALAASSPFRDGQRAPHLDERLHAYHGNCARFPSISARLIPDVLSSEDDYAAKVYDPIRCDLEASGVLGTLEPEWVNARGAIARFDRGSIEIRLIDTQECPRRDLALHAFLVTALKWLSTVGCLDAQEAVPTAALADLLFDAIERGRSASTPPPLLCKAFGLAPQQGTLGSFIERVYAKLGLETAYRCADIEALLQEGSLSERLIRFTGDKPTHEKLQEACRRLTDCLASGVPFSSPIP